MLRRYTKITANDVHAAINNKKGMQ
jgi:hypothetical protein